jgi:sodium-dependent dicarboxylate transporter 2/3/5
MSNSERPELFPGRPQLTERERRFERIRRRAGLVTAPAMFALLWVLDMPTLTPQAHRLAAIMAAVGVLWICESIPLPVTALAGAAACVVLRVAGTKEVFAPFADQLMFLFIGSFILARAIFLHGLDRRLAFGVLSLRWVGASPSRILFGFGAATAFMSAWISNTATTAMMFAIGMSILAFLFRNEQAGGSSIKRRYATGLMLMTSFAASIGGLATPIGTPPNVIGLAIIRRELDVDFPFFKWTLVGLPIVVILFLYVHFYLNLLCPAGIRHIVGSQEMLERERDKLGPWTRGQISTLVAFLLTVTFWVMPGVIALVWGAGSEISERASASLPEAVPALLGAALLFLLPGDNNRRAITWREAVEIDWGVVLLYGGGFALGSLAFDTGLASAVGEGLARVFPLHSTFSLLVVSTLVAVLTSETTSNTASANIVVPVVIGLARSLELDPLLPALGATFGASLGFMLPVSTPCNAIVYGSGYIPIGRMVRYGILLDVAGIVVVVALVRLLAPLLG